MTQEEKAKAYDEALERVEGLIDFCSDSELKTLEYVFPKLKESEDEKIKNGLVRLLKELLELGGVAEDEWDRNECEKYIAWLEKQGEQKSNPVYDIEIPFGAKDSELIEASYYIPEGFHAEIDGNKVVIKSGEQKPAWSEDDKNFMYDTRSNLTELKDRYGEGYGNVGKCIDWLQLLKGRVQQKQEWSEEDERNLQGVIDEIEANKNQAPDYDLATYDRFLSWLKSLKGRVQPQNRWKPSDEQIAQLQIVIDTYGNESIYDPILTELLFQLKKLKEEV